MPKDPIQRLKIPVRRIGLRSGDDSDAEIELRGRQAEVRPTTASGCASAAHLLLPALSDAHVHLVPFGPAAAPALVRAGVTHVRDVGGAISYLRDFIAEEPWPRVSFYGWALDGCPVAPHARLLATAGARSLDSVKRHVDRLVRFGASGLKLYYGFPEVWIRHATERAHDAGLKVAFHLGSGSHPQFRLTSVERALAGGVDTIEHVHSLTGDLLKPEQLELLADDDLEAPGSVFFRIFRAWSLIDTEGALADELIEAFLRYGGTLVPTLSPFAAMLSETEAVDVGVIELVKSHSTDREREQFREGLARMLRLVKRFADAGVRLATGTDTTTSTGLGPDHALVSEMGLLRRAGVSPRATLEQSSVAGQAQLGLCPPAEEDWVLLRATSLDAALRDWAPELVVSGGNVLYQSPAFRPRPDG